MSTTHSFILFPETIQDTNVHGASDALMFASSEGHADVVQLLLQRGADPAARRYNPEVEEA